MQIRLKILVWCSRMLYDGVVKCEVLSEAVSQGVRPNPVRLAVDVCRQPA